MAGAHHLVLLVEEPSMEALLQILLPRVLPAGRSFEIHAFQGKTDLMSKLGDRLRGYAQWLPIDWRLVVVVDRDDDHCLGLKARMEDIAAQAGLMTKTLAGTGRHRNWQVVNRIAVEELEAWYFGDWAAVHAAYPRVPGAVAQRRGLRNPDAIVGGTWETFERLMQRHGYFKAGLAKIEAARAIGPHLDPSRSLSASFRAFHAALTEATA